MSEEKKIPYKIYLTENEMPTQWYNVRADMKVKPAPLLNPETLKPMTYEDLRPVFCDELIKQELDEGLCSFDYPEQLAEIVLIVLTVKLDNSIVPSSQEEIEQCIHALILLLEKGTGVQSGALDYMTNI